MIIVYYSLTGNVKRMVSKLDAKNIEITNNNYNDLQVNEPFILIVPSYDEDYMIPVSNFLENNQSDNFKGVIGSGNLNFSDLYVYVAKDISNDYNVPLLYAFEYSGNENDVNKINKILEELND